MRLSKLFTKTKRKVPQAETAINAQLLMRAGFIDKLSAGIYSYLPLGWRVFKKIENIIREEMDAIGGQEVFLPALHPKGPWEKTGRWQVEEMFKTKSRSGRPYSLGWTHEEIVTPLVSQFVSSYKNLPCYVYQIQDKFRDELRVKSGLLRGIEFVMKDLYSFHRDEKDLDLYYETAKRAYFRIYDRCGIGRQTYLTLASGGTFSKFSHEFQTVTPSGEDEIYLCSKCRLAINREIIKNLKSKCPQCGNKNLEVKKAIEVGNIFKLKDKYSRPFDFYYRDRDGKEKIVMMGCYGIGLGRLLGAIVEVCHDEKGIIWPQSIAPFQVQLINLITKKLKNQKTKADEIYDKLRREGIEVLYDDREVSVGEKFADADLIGIPNRIVISDKTLAKNSLELKKRNQKSTKLIKINNIIKLLKF